MIAPITSNILISLFLISAASSSYALTFSIPSNGNSVGQVQQYRAKEGDTLLKIGAQYGIGAEEMTKANPSIKRNYYIASGTRVNIPSRFRLPSSVPRNGIVLNIAQKRVYYFQPETGKVYTYPVGVGKQGWSTPLGSTQITGKQKNPSWRPTASIRNEAARRGRTLPSVVGPGPKNPLGRYAMQLGFPRILMHGTTSPGSIGLRSSHGCIRMFSRDIEELFNNVSVGTPVKVIYEPG
jgi:L,D-transpeptidase ErfK/SrfK